MLVVHSPASLLHDPSGYFRRGQTVEHPEQARRYSILRDAVAEAGHRLGEPRDHGLAPITAVHDAGYLDLLSTVWSRRAELPGIGEEILTGHFARPQMARRPEGLLGQLGYHMADTSTPVRARTWEAIYSSAQVALEGAACLLERRGVYALCRPPGHHAYADSAGGFCFLNNTAIAAQSLRSAMGGRVAILDIDVHHGNGTQGIFWSRPDVLTVSIHADPSNYFPFYAGYADETGGGEGRGFNRNLVLPEGSGDAPWLGAIRDAMGQIDGYGPAALVVALGFDASEHDPIGAFRVTTDGFSRAAEIVAGFRGPVLLVQEGGYLCEALPKNLVAFLAAFEGARR
ncbi:histone deacetylase family protein [Enterovirga rhinocerotis]|uniref:Acetoin utilization deacetylase AcuC-like enzyme n=1 Tax=Enterovirga rhinocerotis TaxID=1339210 RepID=A0A4R7C8K4_9HYPH|nr:histone deacetylase family protein [Enterovirga rhinocerotis]TDR94768.1 acetoin utilization deacetylase AcuC-like enzyme [Enterovirga rhinocerotis]